MSTPGVYLDECGGSHKYSGCVQHTRAYIKNTPGVFSTPGDYHEISRCMWGLS